MAAKNKVFLNFDAEHFHFRDLTIKLIFHFLTEHQQFDNFHYFGFVIQAYLKDSLSHFRYILLAATKRNHVIPLRLVKGAYWDAETVAAKVQNNDSPQFLNKEETDIQYRYLIHQILDQKNIFQLCIASHNVDDHCYAETLRDTRYLQAPIIEHQTLHMTYEPLSMAAALYGWPIRNYLPTGSLLVGMGYLVRRIMENASQTGVLTAARHHHFTPGAPSLTNELLLKIKAGKYVKDPATKIASSTFSTNQTTQSFLQEEYSSFLDANRNSYLIQNNSASDPLFIYSKFSSKRLLGRLQLQNQSDAKLATKQASAAFLTWRQTEPAKRANYLQKTAQLLRLEKFAITKLIMEEAGKTKIEALGDLDEAIDFLNYYASEIRHSPQNTPGPIGVFAIISPWNFPLAILCGMAAAALVTGNTVILKPAEQTPLTAMAFYNLLQKAEIPKDVFQVLIGNGETLGVALVEDPAVKGIAFTGSKQVGISIYTRSLVMAFENKIEPRAIISVCPIIGI